MTKKKIRVTVSRFDSDVETEPHQQIYEVPLTDGMSVLDVLDYIFENIDSSLAYYSHAACRHGLCGKCILVVNGISSIACQTPVTEDIVIQTPSKFKVIRDLVYTTTK
jgi:fumarate reductase iron-sulfur subunit